MLEKIKNGIIVSCQAISSDPTFGPEIMVAYALAAKKGGAVGIRANSDIDVAAIKKATNMPVIGIWKRPGLDQKGHIITPTINDVELLVAAGADCIALDVTDRPRPNGINATTLIKNIKEIFPKTLLMADCVNLKQAQRAQEAGVDIAATTLSKGKDPYKPDLVLLSKMVNLLNIPVIAEGRYWNPEDVNLGFKLGAYAIVIGSSITRPWLITERYVKAIP